MKEWVNASWRDRITKASGCEATTFGLFYLSVGILATLIEHKLYDVSLAKHIVISQEICE